MTKPTNDQMASTTKFSLKRKLKTFSVDPLGSSAKVLRKTLWRSQVGRAKQRLADAGVLDVVAQFVKDRPAHAMHLDYLDLWFLFHTVKSRKPKVILEFGSGFSTVVFGKALKDNYELGGNRGIVYSVDADPYWTKVSSKSIPLSLKEFCRISYSPLEQLIMGGAHVVRHTKVPNVIPDLLYLDGPAFTDQVQVAIDPLDIESRFPDTFMMVVDGRKKNVEFLRQNLKKSYRVERRRLQNNYVFERQR